MLSFFMFDYFQILIVFIVYFVTFELFVNFFDRKFMFQQILTAFFFCEFRISFNASVFECETLQHCELRQLQKLLLDAVERAMRLDWRCLPVESAQAEKR